MGFPLKAMSSPFSTYRFVNIHYLYIFLDHEEKSIVGQYETLKKAKN